MHTLVKICGITNLADALWAIECGADFLGFIFVPKSPRFISADQVADITRELPAGIRKVGVFMNHTAAEVERILDQCGLDIAQLHGDEPPETARAVGLERVWKAVSVAESADIGHAVTFPASAILLDTMADGQRGGTGQVSDWRLAAAVAAERKVMLAGGLNPENVARAVAVVQPYGVDVSSGVEATPGRKDHDKVRRFILNAKTEAL